MSIVHVTFSGKHFTRTQTLFCDKSRVKMYSSKDIFLTQAFELYEKEKLKNTLFVQLWVYFVMEY